jgi:oligoendopeptidase F
MLQKLGLLIVSGWVALPMLAQGFEPIAPAQAPQYRFNLAHGFYADEAGYAKDLAEVKSIVESLQGYRGKVAASGPTLFEMAARLERLDVLTSKLYIYRFLRYATDSTREAQFSAAEQEISGLNSQVAFVATELRKTSREDLERLIKEEPRLAPYRFSLEQNTRYKAYTLTTGQEELLSRFSPQLYSWEGQLFQRLIDRTTFTELETPAGRQNVYRDRQLLSKQPDRELRKKALLTLYDEYQASGDLFGFAVIKLAGALNAEATTRGFRDAFASSLFDAHLSSEQAETFFKTIAGFADLSRRFFQLKKERIRRTSGIADPAPWDNDVVPTGFERPRFTIDQATEALKASLAFHGPRYSADLAELLDPTNGRLDIVPGKNRMPGAFSWGYYEAPRVFYSFGYRGYLDDVLTLSHEGGHAVHYDLISQNKVLPVYASGPQYFTESFAMLNEFATADYLYQHATSREQKTYFLEQLLDVMMRRFFDIVMRSEFEYRAYQKIQAGEISDAAQLHELWKEEGLRYVGDDYERHEFLKRGWAFTPHFFTSPRYYINYLFANLMAISYYQRRLVDPDFDRRYVELMANGFPDTPVNLLKKHLDLDPFDPARVADAMKALEGKLAELEALY